MPWPENDPLAKAGITAFAQALQRLGWIEGKNIHIDYRFAAADPALFTTDAAELVGMTPDAIFAGGSPALAALQSQTHTIPIVFVLVPDPVGQGFVQSLARPGGNITGFSSSDPPLMGKWLQLLKEIAPRVTQVAVIFNPDTAPFARLFNPAIEAAARTLGMEVTLAPVRDDGAIAEALTAKARQPGGGLIRLPDSFTTSHRDAIIGAAARNSLPSVGGIGFSAAGGLMSYYLDPIDLHAQAASYIDRILKGRQSGRPPRSISDEIHAGHQSQDRPGARPQRAAIAPAAGRRSDRVGIFAPSRFCGDPL
jgi:putative tryptophan/tyrosine transport system substrate-binding protein